MAQTKMAATRDEDVLVENRKLSKAELEEYSNVYLTTRYMDMRCDWAFKHIMRDLNNLKMLISDVLEEEVCEISHLPNEIDRFLGMEKDVTTDVLCKDQQGREFIVEVQKRKTMSFRDRIFYYGASMVHAQVARGGDYQQMRPVYVICFVDYEYCHTEDRLVYRYALKEETTNERYGNQLTICVCELPRMKDKEFSEMKHIEVWLHLFNKMYTFADEPEGLPERFATVLKAAQIKGLRTGERNQYLQAMISQREREDIGGAYYLDGHKDGFKEGKAEGMAEGKAEGRQDALMETALKMQAAGMDAQLIKQMTGVEL